MLKKFLKDQKKSSFKEFEKEGTNTIWKFLKKLLSPNVPRSRKYESDFFCCQELSRGNSPIHSWSSTSSFISKLSNKAFISNVEKSRGFKRPFSRLYFMYFSIDEGKMTQQYHKRLYTTVLATRSGHKIVENLGLTFKNKQNHMPRTFGLIHPANLTLSSDKLSHKWVILSSYILRRS